MTQRVPISVHLDLYRYWDGKRAGRRMPARPDIDPADIPQLLPHLSLVEAVGEGEFRYRLVGTQVVRELGRDVTGEMVGRLVKPPSYGASLRAQYARVCRERMPYFLVGAFRSRAGMTHAISRLLLPLGPTDDRGTMVLQSRLIRHSIALRVPSDWLGTVVGAIEGEDRVDSLATLEALAAAWERRCAG